MKRILVSSMARSLIRRKTITRLVNLHIAGDWGDVDIYERLRNSLAERLGCRVCSLFHLRPGVIILVITPARNRPVIVLTPEEYDPVEMNWFSRNGRTSQSANGLREFLSSFQLRKSRQM